MQFLRHTDNSRSNLTSMIRSSKANALLKRKREPRRVVLASFAIAIGAALCSPANAHAPMARSAIKINDKIEAKRYAKNLLSKSQYSCLNALYSKESAWNKDAYNKSGAYGIPQLKNDMIKNMSGSMQVMYGIKYINHRYNGNPCIAYSHWIKYGWH